MSFSQFKSFLIQAGLATEFSLFVGLVLIILIVAFFPKVGFGLSFWITVFALGTAFYVASFTPESGSYQSFSFRPFSHYLKQFFCISASVALFGFMEWRQARRDSARPEVFILLLLSVIGLCVMIQANSFWLLFLAAELFSICAFAFAKPLNTNESNLKSMVQYFGVGALASALGLFGLSWMMGFSLSSTGADYDASIQIFQTLGSFFFIAFLLFKLGAFPFHFWVPSVYPVAPTPWLGYISVAPKVAAAFALLYLAQKQSINIALPLVVLSILGMTYGNLAALRSKKMKLVLAYSAISQAGMLLIPSIISFHIPNADSQLLIFAIGYAIVNQGAFCAVQYFENSIGDDFNIADLGGKILLHPLAGISLIILVLSLIGLPPTIGFTGKLLVFSTLIPGVGIWESKLVLFVFAAAVFNTLLSLAFYYQIPYQLIFKESRSETPAVRASIASLFWAIVSAFFALLAFAKPGIFFPLQ